MTKWIESCKSCLQSKKFVTSLVTALILLGSSIFVNYYAGNYATEIASNSVTDIILSNTRVYDLDGIFVYGSVIFWIFIVILCVARPSKVPFVLKSVSLFVIIRSIFVISTHIGPFPTHVIVTSDIISDFTFGGDLFFSGHTGLPFLMMLIFWKNVPLRIIFFCVSILFAIVVLLTHLHYTIDVLGAFFITYTIFHIAEVIFRSDYLMFLNGFANEKN